METFQTSKGVTRLYTREKKDADKSKERFTRARKVKSATTINEESVRDLARYYEIVSGSKKNFGDFVNMKKLNTMNMTILARVYYLMEQKVEFREGNRAFETAVTDLLEVFKKSVSKKVQQGGEGSGLIKIRLMYTMEIYRIALVNFQTNEGYVVKSSTVEAVVTE